MATNDGTNPIMTVLSLVGAVDECECPGAYTLYVAIPILLECLTLDSPQLYATMKPFPALYECSLRYHFFLVLNVRRRR